MVKGRRISTIDKFNKYAVKGQNPDDCWLWTGYLDKDGYGRPRIDGKNIRANRLSYSLFVGAITKDMLVLHTCDVPACVNPKHLFLGTPLSNMQDKVRKGRFRNGHESKTHCLRGHEFNKENTRIRFNKDGSFKSRNCRACVRHKRKIRTKRYELSLEAVLRARARLR